MKAIITGGSGFIGTNLVERFLQKGWDLLNIDVTEPKIPNHTKHWRKVGLLDRKTLIDTFVGYQPDVVLHLAARTDLDETRHVEGYAANIDGVSNVIEAVRRAGSVERSLFFSTRLVCEIGYMPKSDTDYRPTTLYGESKVRGEELVREATGTFGPWVIVRPTSIWGPWFGVPYNNFFKSVARGVYMHPGRHNPRKSYGYVGNTVYEIERITEAPVEKVDGKTLYLCDYPPLRLRDWAVQVQKALGARPIRTAPMPLLKLAAASGDAAKALGWRHPPLTRFRLDNLLTDMAHDTGELESIVGPLPFSTEEGVVHTVDWLKDHDELETRKR